MDTTTLFEVDLKTVIDEMFLVLTEKEKEVVIRRFSLNEGPKQTLERIGQHFNVTRERIRQIENIALLKLRRHISNSQLSFINKSSKAILEHHGGVMSETALIAETLNAIGKTNALDGSIIKLSLAIDDELAKNERSEILNPAWRFNAISIHNIKSINDHSFSFLKKKGSIIKFSDIYQHIQKLDLFHDRQPTTELIKSCLGIDRRLRETEKGWGLMEWRFINPRSIRDRALIILRKEKKPLHFVDIANKITEVGIQKKTVTTQAVHNELIRYDDFVLVGRGLYALKEWGYTPGTVADIIANILKEHGALAKKKIIEEVQKQREVQIGTISLNLQKKPYFIRVGRAVYDYKKES
jgi:DNA-directed RNA polymerase delta subunit